MTTEQPPAQKRSLASKGTCCIARVRGLLNGTLIFCSTKEISNFTFSVYGGAKRYTRCASLCQIVPDR
jgi:hypothetical protein